MSNPVKKPSWWDEFVAFAVKGNAMALAVGTIIGAAFSTITSSLTNDVIMPIVAIFMGGIEFSELILENDIYLSALASCGGNGYINGSGNAKSITDIHRSIVLKLCERAHCKSHKEKCK